VVLKLVVWSMVLSCVWRGARPARAGFLKHEGPSPAGAAPFGKLYEHECSLPPGYAGSHHLVEMCAFVFM